MTLYQRTQLLLPAIALGRQVEVDKIALDTGHKFNLHQTFRKRPVRVLNVLCEFDLPPGSSGVFAVQINVNNVVYYNNFGL